MYCDRKRLGALTMKNPFLQLVILMTAILFLSALSYSDPYSNSDTDAGCRTMVADGQLQNGDRFTGRLDATGSGKVDGVWYHQTPKGDQFHIRKVDWVVTPIDHSETEKEGPDFDRFMEFCNSLS